MASMDVSEAPALHFSHTEMRSHAQKTMDRIDSGSLALLEKQSVALRAPAAPLEQYLPFGKPDFSSEEIDAVTRVMRSGWIGMGPETLAFEKELAASLDVPHVVTVNSCTSALYLALLLNGVGEGDEVICPSLTWCATANAAIYLGAKPVFCDVDPETLSVSAKTVLGKVTNRTRAVVVVHFGGFAVDVDEIRAALPDQVAIVEDAAHAFGSRFPNGKAVGASGNLTCFSFYANKNLSTGEGGAIALFDDEEADHLRSLRQNGMPINAWSRFSKPKSVLYSNLTELGYKMNFIDLQAAIGRVQLKRQPEFRALRADIARLYCEELEQLEPRLRFQSEVLHSRHARHLFTVTLPLSRFRISRDEFLLQLRAMNIGASIHYAPLHTMPLYASSGRPYLPHTEQLADAILTLPISSSMTLDDASHVTSAFEEVFYRTTT
jgi:dTDP-4-amino-4,6-dideoxygalactose transaminase